MLGRFDFEPQNLYTLKRLNSLAGCMRRRDFIKATAASGTLLFLPGSAGVGKSEFCHTGAEVEGIQLLEYFRNPVAVS